MCNAPQIVRLDAQGSVSDATLALLTATISGDSFVGIYDDRDHLRYANDAFLKAFSLKAGDEATFASIILKPPRKEGGPH